jgi:VIT1/CCC1 family predicted Fe2+/Mn2+ transporter
MQAIALAVAALLLVGFYVSLVGRRPSRRAAAAEV